VAADSSATASGTGRRRRSSTAAQPDPPPGTEPPTVTSMPTSIRKHPIAAVSGLLCFVLTVGGMSGLLHQWLGWIQFPGFPRFLVPHSYEIYSYVVMIVLGLAIGVAGDAVTRRKAGR